VKEGGEAVGRKAGLGTSVVTPDEVLLRQAEIEAKRAGYCGIRHDQLVAELFRAKLAARDRGGS
jgi:hypothetical protein